MGSAGLPCAAPDRGQRGGGPWYVGAMASTSMEMSASAKSGKQSAHTDLDESIAILRDKARPFARLSPAARADLLRACIPRLAEVTPRWVEAAIRAKGLPAGAPASSEEILAGPIPVMRNARLFGFFTTSPVRVAQIDKAAGAILSDMPVSGIPVPSAWAFSFWGGAFYLYTSDGLSNSTVTRFDPTTKTVDTSYVLTAPAIIDGAGVSTCAPLKPTT